MASGKLPGYVRIFLIVIILLTSLSMAFILLFLNTNRYSLDRDENQGYFIKNAVVFDGERVIGKTHIAILGEVIDCVGLDCEPKGQMIEIDAEGKALLPGLIDLHIHFYAPSKESEDLSNFSQLLDYIKQRPTVRENLHAAGITTIRSVGDIPENILKLRQLIEAGELSGPEIFTTGPLFTAPGGHPAGTIYKGNDFLVENGTRQVDTAETARKEVKTLAGMGVHGIKAVYDDINGKYPKLDSVVLKALIDEAHQNGLWITVHTGSARDVSEAVRWGADGIEHGTAEPLDSLTIEMIAAKEILYVPTLAVIEREGNAETLEACKHNVSLLHDAGVLLGTGTDTQGKMAFGESLRREMELLIEAGLSEEEVLSAATFQAALGMKLSHDRGKIEAGKRADLIMINGKPWENFADIIKISALWQKGEKIR